MLYNYKEVLEIYKTDYMIKKAIKEKIMFKVEKGLYSDGRNNYTMIEIILKKYNSAFLVKDSALHSLGFLDKAPEKIHVGTPRNALRINDDRVVQHFYSNFLDEEVPYRREAIEHILSIKNLGNYRNENGNEIRVLNPRALFFDLIRDRKKYPADEFWGIIEKFKNSPTIYSFEPMGLSSALSREGINDIIDYKWDVFDIALEIARNAWDNDFWAEFDF